MEYSNRCMKFDLPNGSYVDLLEQVLSSMSRWRQVDKGSSEAAGFLLGYQNKHTYNITISNLTEPKPKDVRSRFFCAIKDAIHFHQLKKNTQQQNYYIGSWHTHPQAIPEPSHVDWCDWTEALNKDKSGANYLIFIILGTKEFRVWIGDPTTKIIIEIFQTEMTDELYIKGGEQCEN